MHRPPTTNQWMQVLVLYKPEEDDTPAKSEMTVLDSDSQLKVVRHRDEPMGGQMTQPVRPRSRHKLSVPTVDLDLVTGKCKPGKVIEQCQPHLLRYYRR